MSVAMRINATARRPTDDIGCEESMYDEPATKKQREFADRLGIKYPKKISKGELSDMITEITGK